MKITSTYSPTVSNPKRTTRERSAPLDGIKDTFHRGYVNTLIAFPGAIKGGMIGAAIGFANALPFTPLFGLKPALATAAVLGGVGLVAGGALYHSLAGLD